MRAAGRDRNICVAMPHTDLNHAVASIDPPRVNWLDNRRHALLVLPARKHVVGNVYQGPNGSRFFGGHRPKAGNDEPTAR